MASYAIVPLHPTIVGSGRILSTHLDWGNEFIFLRCRYLREVAMVFEVQGDTPMGITRRGKCPRKIAQGQVACWCILSFTVGSNPKRIAAMQKTLAVVDGQLWHIETRPLESGSGEVTFLTYRIPLKRFTFDDVNRILKSRGIRQGATWHVAGKVGTAGVPNPHGKIVLPARCNSGKVRGKILRQNRKQLDAKLYSYVQRLRKGEAVISFKGNGDKPLPESILHPYGNPKNRCKLNTTKAPLVVSVRQQVRMLSRCIKLGNAILDTMELPEEVEVALRYATRGCFDERRALIGGPTIREQDESVPVIHPSANRFLQNPHGFNSVMEMPHAQYWIMPEK